MPFNSSSKINVMHLGRNNKQYTYYMGTHESEDVKEENDLGVLFSVDL